MTVYKSFLSDDSEIVIANFARPRDVQSVVSLGSWAFLCFIGFPKLIHELTGMSDNPLLSHIFMLVRHINSGKVHILALELDPWIDIDDPG